MKRKFFIVLLELVSVVCCVLMFSACGGEETSNGGSSSLDGIYYVYRNEKHEMDNWIKISGSNWEDDDGVGGTLERNGNNLSFNGTVFGETGEIYSGTYVSDGILKIKVFGADIYYCKEDKTPPDGNVQGGGNQNQEPAQKYTVTYNANGGEFADGETFTQEVNGNSLLTAPTQPTRARYTFGGWAKDKNGKNLWQFATDKVTENITLFAVWQEPSASILSVEGASIDGDEILMIVSPETDKVSLANKVICSSDSSWKLYFDSMGQTEIPTRIAANLNGSLSNGDNEFYIVVTSANASQVNTYKLIVHRQYTVNVIYYDNKNIPLKTETALTGETYNVTYTPDITGYTFNYWQDKDGKEYKSNVLYSGLNLYANATAKTYKITLNVNGGELSTTEKTVTYDKSYSLPKPTKTGYSFLGWGNSNGNTLFTDNSGASLENWTGTSDITLYAKWQANQYKVILNKDLSTGGSVSGDGDHAYDSQVTITANTYSGYTWLGWYKGTEQVSTEYTYRFKMGFAVTYTAKWIKCPVTLERSDTAAGTVSGVDKTVLGAQTTITAKTNKGYTFVGWYKGDDQLTTELTYTFKLEETPVTYMARWIKVTLAKSYTDAGTITSLDKTYKAGESVTVTAGATKLGYTWLGWYNNETELTTDLSYTFDMPKENVTYTAKWEFDKALSNFIFTSTQDTCIISGLKDYGVDTIIVPDYVTEIKSGTFKGCSKVESITLPFVGGSIKTENDTYQYPFGYIFGISIYNGASAVKQYYYGRSTSSTTNSTYYIPTSLKTVTISGGNILCGAFYNCSSLESINIPDGVTSIGEYAFSYCTSLTSITIPDNVTSIGEEAFSYCTSLTSITMGNSVTSIGSEAFSNCTNLTSITIPDSVTSIGEWAFGDCTSLTSITMGNSVTSIGEWAFSYCSSLESITIPDSVTSIDYRAFYNCTSLTSITMGNSVTSIGSEAFKGCTSLTSITIPDSVTSIGEWAFGDCTSLTSITMGNSVTSIGSEAFKGCTSLTSITIPDSVTSIGEWAFGDCTSLTSITIGNSVTSIGYAAFSNCTNLTSITIPDSVTSIGYAAFRNCTNLESITIGNGVTSIGDRAFDGCTSLESVTFKNTRGWKVSTSSNMSNAINVSVTDPSQNATYLKSIYYNYYWERY